MASKSSRLSNETLTQAELIIAAYVREQVKKGIDLTKIPNPRTVVEFGFDRWVKGGGKYK